MADRDRLKVEQVSERLHVASTPHVNWAIYVGEDGVTLIDSGYPGQFALLERSLQTVGAALSDVDAVIITHAHIDHIGGAIRMTADFGTPVLACRQETDHLHRDYVEQAGITDVVIHAWRPRVLRWAVAVRPLVEGDAQRGIPTAAEFSMPRREVRVPGAPRPIILPGHTSGHTSFEFESEGVLIVGDAIVTSHGTTRNVGPQLLPTMFEKDLALAAESSAGLADSRAEVFVPGHGAVWRGPASTLVAEARRFGAEW